MAAPRKYPDELREREGRAGRPRGACRRIGDQLGINPGTLRGWVTIAEIDAGVRPGVTTDQAHRLAELERENRELRRANAILKVGVGFRRGGARPATPVVIDYIDQHKHCFGVEPICAVLVDADVPIAPSTYDASKPGRRPNGRAPMRKRPR